MCHMRHQMPHLAMKRRHPSQPQCSPTEATNETSRQPEENSFWGSLVPTSFASDHNAKLLTNPQLVLLVLLSMTVSRLAQIKTASIRYVTSTDYHTTDSYLHIRDLNQSHLSNPHVVNPVCQELFSDPNACSNYIVPALLFYKYHSGLVTFMLVLAGSIQIWQRASMLERYLSLFILSPLGLGMISLYWARDALAPGQLALQLRMGILFCVMALPWKTISLTFSLECTTSTVFQRTSRRNVYPSRRSLQGFALFLLGLGYLYEAARCLEPLFLSFRSGGDFMLDIPQAARDLLIDNPYFSADRISTASIPIFYLLVVDKLTNTFVCWFGWLFFRNSQQRVCIALSDKQNDVFFSTLTKSIFIVLSQYFLLLVATIHAFILFHQLPLLKSMRRGIEILELICLVLGTMSAIVSVLPNCVVY